MRRVKELNAAFNTKLFQNNLQDIASVRQQLSQSRIELRRNANESTKLKEQLSQVIWC